MKIILLSLFLIGVKCANITDEEKIYTYTAAVVEYLPIENNSIPGHEYLNMNSIEYINMLNNVSQELDLILFPEATLGGGTAESTVVPVPYTEIICNSSDTQYQDYLKKFSCAAIIYNTTIVVNIIEKENCTGNNATGFCPSSGIIYYNSNVAFNESGGVIARYRKWNLFGEYGKSPPSEVELVVITTKNNDSFGMFTCFDIMFNQPALNLTRNLGLKNILFPTMWYSELPYLTALQVQQMWAQENDVNLLSAGANTPQTGTGGTGIFIGKEGPLQYEMIGGEGGTRVIVENVPRPEIEDNPYRVIAPIEDDIDAVSKKMDSFFLLTDSAIHNYSSVVLNTNQTTITEEVCNGNDIKLCCQFSINISVDQNAVLLNENKYTYHLAAFNGIRTFSGVRDGGIESCGVIACLNESILSCGRRNASLTPAEMVLGTLRYLATGSILQVIGDNSGFDKSTASRVIGKVVPVIAQLHNEYIKMPDTLEEQETVMKGFYNISRFPNCVGAIDCTHVKIQSPGGENAEVFRNRKTFFSMNVQMVCDSDLIVRDVVCRWPGSAHDSTIFNNSRLKARLERGDFGNSVLVGDSGYAIKKYLLTPLHNPQTRAEQLYNESQIRTRNVIERVFGVMKRRFPVLANGIRLKVEKVEAIVVACAILHNIARQMGEPDLNVNNDIEEAIELVNGVNPDLQPDEDVNININNLHRYNLINQYFQALI